MKPEERQEIRERHVQSILEYGYKCLADGQDWPCDTARLLADYDHLVEVAREYFAAEDRWTASGMKSPYGADADRAADALRAIIDPATPEPVEGEKP